MEGGEGDEVGLLLPIWGWDGQDGVTDLLDVDCAAEGCFLCVVALEVDASGEVGDGVGCRGWVVTVERRTISILSLGLGLEVR